MEKITVPARAEELETVNGFIEEKLEALGCPMRARMQIALAVEEIFVNISSYAYRPEDGEAEICVDAAGDPPRVTIQFLDRGRPFDPLKRPDADTTLSAEERDIGGLGILLVKKTMDQVTYAYEDGKNILTIEKSLGKQEGSRHDDQ